MENKLHLISNAHIDPIWQWEWEEGCAAAVSTFRCAARFCREFDNYIFCHNESLIYRWIEEYEPSLFEEIKELVRLGKWHIMGGWHVQPDCNMPSGEAFARQVAEGRRYFREKFGKEPTTAINFDPFGHTRGLVQILSKSGYDSYLFCRPDNNNCPLPSETFTWIGYDGSKVYGQRSAGGYGTALGHATDKIRATISSVSEENPISFCLWGVGDHGGGPSREDIREINKFIDEAKKDGVSVLHSTPEEYFSDIRSYVKETGKEPPSYEGDLNSWAPGCYTSVVRIKQKYRETENMLFLTEKMVTHAASLGVMEYPEEEFGKALYDMLTVQFHDVLPGSSIQAAEETAIRMMDHALEILSRVRMRAFLSLSDGQPEAKDGEIPVLAYNPHPYPVEEDLVCEFMLSDQNWSGTYIMPVAYHNGEKVPSQCEKERSNIPLDWRKQVVFHATLAPMSMNRFDCRLITLDKKPVCDINEVAGKDPSELCLSFPCQTVRIDRTTGLISQWNVNGRDYLGHGAFELCVMRDYDDSWGMTCQSWKEKVGKFELLSPEEGTRFSDVHVTEPIPSVRIIEDGEVRIVVEALFGYEESKAVIRYKISKVTPSVDIDIRVINMTKTKMIKLSLPQSIPDACPSLEVAFGEEPMKDTGKECVGQKYLTVTGSDGSRLNILNRGIYGYSYDREEGNLYLTLLRSPGYTAHPLGPGRPVMPCDRWSEHMEQGERQFSLRLVADSSDNLSAARQALSFNETPMVLSFFPSGDNEMNPPVASLPYISLKDNMNKSNAVVLTALKKAINSDETLIRLFNSSKENVSCMLVCPSEPLNETITFTPYEVRTFRIRSHKLCECRMDEMDFD